MKRFFFLGPVALVAACGGSVATIDGGPTNDGGSSNDASSSQDGTIGFDAGSGKKCGTSSECAPSEYCDLNGHCDFAAQKRGTCKPRPSGCPDLYAPTCACDGKVYSNECDVHANGVDVNKEGGCNGGPPGWVSCGQGYCSKDFSYCEKTGNDAIDPNDPVKFFYQCKNLPQSCQGKTSCVCFDGKTLCSAAQCTYQDGFTILCPGG
jgi:hypothetical protein